MQEEDQKHGSIVEQLDPPEFKIDRTAAMKINALHVTSVYFDFSPVNRKAPMERWAADTIYAEWIMWGDGLDAHTLDFNVITSYGKLLRVYINVRELHVGVFDYVTQERITGATMKLQ